MLRERLREKRWEQRERDEDEMVPWRKLSPRERFWRVGILQSVEGKPKFPWRVFEERSMEMTA